MYEMFKLGTSKLIVIFWRRSRKGASLNTIQFNFYFILNSNNNQKQADHVLNAVKGSLKS